MLVFSDVTVTGKKLRPVTGLSFSADEGEIFGLIGTGSSGRSTAVRAAAGLARPRSGHITWKGTDLWERPEVRRRVVTFLPEAQDRTERITAAEYLEFFANLCGLEGLKARSRAMDALSFTEMEDAAHVQVSDLSLADRRRLSMARARIEDPELLLIEEWSDSRDMRGRTPLSELLREMASQGTTVLLGASSAAEIMNVCSRVGVLQEGNLVLCGRIDEIRDRSRSRDPLEIRVCGREEELLALLREDKTVRSIAVSGPVFSVRTTCTEEEEAALLRRIVEAGIPVCGFTRRSADPDGEMAALLGRAGKVVSSSEP